MKKKFIFIAIAIFIMAAGLFGYYSYSVKEYVEKCPEKLKHDAQWDKIIASVVNRQAFLLTIDGKKYASKQTGLYMDDSRNIMMSMGEFAEAFDCAVNYYKNGLVKVEKGTHVISMELNKNAIEVNGIKAIPYSTVQEKEGTIYLPVNTLCDVLEYSYTWDGTANQAVINNENAKGRTIPYSYDYTLMGRAPGIKNQGAFGTCWAFAALTALESSLLPEEKIDFSEDHMSLNNSFQMTQQDGGDYNMAAAYLVSWQGPVLEKDDPYGDGVTNHRLKAVKHVQEIQIVQGKDLQAVKKMVFKYGGVESAIYMAGDYHNLADTGYYNLEKNAYCYIGTDKPNHDVVIIGWDDNYPKENFAIQPEGNGAFLCRNSWGREFGDNGNFYVSYYDTNIAVHSVAYTKVEAADNYDNLYQSDLCGFAGLLGYNRESAYFANVYTAEQDEVIEAVGLYATGKDTQFNIYVVKNFEDEDSLNKRGEVNTKETVTNIGYYTVTLDKPVSIKEGEKFAIVVKVSTPNVKRPVAIEYAASYQTQKVDLTDGQGYISLRGVDWESTEEKHQCNVCLKVYTRNKSRKADKVQNEK